MYNMVIGVPLSRAVVEGVKVYNVTELTRVPCTCVNAVNELPIAKLLTHIDYFRLTGKE